MGHNIQTGRGTFWTG